VTNLKRFNPLIIASSFQRSRMGRGLFRVALFQSANNRVFISERKACNCLANPKMKFQSANNRVFISETAGEGTSQADLCRGFNPLIIASSFQRQELVHIPCEQPLCFNPLIIASSFQRRRRW
jgi:hypothetical protein